MHSESRACLCHELTHIRATHISLLAQERLNNAVAVRWLVLLMCAARAARSWEEALGQRDWERDVQDVAGGSDSEREEDYDACTPQEAGEELRNFLVELKIQGALTAKQSCVLAWWRQKAGAMGEFKIAYPPDKQAGAYSRHFDCVTKHDGLDDSGFYIIKDVPVHRRADASMTGKDVVAFSPLDAVAEEFAGNEHMDFELAKRIADDQLPPCYYETPAYKNGKTPFPCALYVDGVAFTRTDKIIGFWLENLITHVRTLMVALRHSTMCRCGCRGYCAIHPIMMFLHWAFASLDQGVNPLERHDHISWLLGSDDARAGLAGAALGFTAVALFLKCDMMEFVTTFGFPSWAANAYPCPLCWRTKKDWQTIAGISLHSLPWLEKDWGNYEASRSRCEIWVDVPANLFKRTRGLLLYDKRRDGNRGRCLAKDMPELGLCKGDRLEPSPSLMNCSAIDKMEPDGPARLLFWRRAFETMARRRCALFDPTIGLTPQLTLAPDWLHALSLGVFKFILAFLFRMMLERDVLRFGGTDKSDMAQRYASFLKAFLSQWYKHEEEQGRSPTKTQQLTAEMLFGSGSIGAWGSETNAMLMWSLTLLDSYGGEFPEVLRRNILRGINSAVGAHRCCSDMRQGSVPPAMGQAWLGSKQQHATAPQTQRFISPNAIEIGLRCFSA